MNQLLFIGIVGILLILSILFKKNKFVFIVLALLFILLSAFRGLEVGTDVLNYKQIFGQILSSGYNVAIEPLWIALNYTSYNLGFGFRGIIVVSALLTLLPIFFVIFKESRNPILSLFFYYVLYIYFFSFNGIRQAIAISIVFLGFYFLKEQKIIPFVVTVIIASFFHISALVCLVVLLIRFIPQKNIIYISIVLVSWVVGLTVADKLFLWAMYVFNYTSYQTAELGNIIGNALFQGVLSMFFIFCLYTVKDKTNLYFNIFFIAVVFSNLLARVPHGNRIFLYFSIIQVLFLPILFYQNKLQQKMSIRTVIILYGMLMFYYKFGFHGIFPYQNILFM